jgi:hypothetical protein
MYAALDINIPNYASAIVTSDGGCASDLRLCRRRDALR